jgi:hypothetical protein
VVNVHELTDTWSKYVAGELVDRKVYRTIDGQMAPERDELGDNNEDAWPRKNGTPKDPWQRAVYLPMKDSNGDVVAFKATGTSAIAEIAELAGMFASADRKGKLPVVALECRNFESQHGSTIYVPVFRLVDWDYWQADTPAPKVELIPLPSPLPPPENTAPTSPESKVSAKSSKRGNARSDMDDEIPF